MTTTHRYALAVAAVLLLAGCGAKRPVLYPNEHLKQVGNEQAKADIAACEALAEEYASSNVQPAEVAKETAKGGVVGAAGGAVGGAIGGDVGTGAAAGAAAGATVGLVGALFRGAEPSAAYMNWVDRCLSEKGYQTVGWE